MDDEQLAKLLEEYDDESLETLMAFVESLGSFEKQKPRSTRWISFAKRPDQRSAELACSDHVFRQNAGSVKCLYAGQTV